MQAPAIDSANTQKADAVQLSMQAELASMRLQLQALQESIANLSHENALLKRRLLGTKSERSKTSEMQLTLGNLLDSHKALQEQLDELVAAAESDASSDDDAKPAKGKHKPSGRRDLSVSNLVHDVVDIIDPELEKTAKRAGHDDAYLLMRVVGGWSVLVKRTFKYEVQNADGTKIVSAPQPKTVFRKALLHSSAIAHILMQKFSLGVPLYRLEQHMLTESVQLDRGTMCRYVDEAGGALGATIVHAMWQDARNNACVIATDATSALIQPDKGTDNLRQACKKGHFFTAIADCDHVLFAYTERHTQEAVKQLFGAFSGYLQCDASNVYDILDRGPPKDDDDKVELVGCFAHCRRYFFEAALCKYTVGVEGLARIRAMYAVDESFKKLPPNKRSQTRETHLRPLIDSFFEWVHQAKHAIPGRNLATKALGYAANQEHELRGVLKDPRIPLDNTRSERALRKIVVGRKNWMFYGSDAHAESAAALFTIIASCRLHKVDPQRYLDEVLRVLPYWPKERYLELAPKYWPATRAKLEPAELARDLGDFTVPTN